MDSDPKIESRSQDLILTEIMNALNNVNRKLDSLVELNKKLLKVNEDHLKNAVDDSTATSKLIAKEPDAMALLSLPMALRKTIMVLYQLDEATADDLARETGRLRAVESAAANQLVRMGYLKKRREGRDVYFYIGSGAEIED
jgi:DNA-binding transcriptional ArsR family regulator